MPTYIRLIIMIGEMIGLGIVSVLIIKKEMKLEEIETKEKQTFRDAFVGSDVWLFIILNIINICIFVFSFYDLRFCSYHKLVLISSFTIFTILFIITVLYHKKHTIFFITATISLFVEILLVCGFMTSLIAPLAGVSNELIPIKKVINEEKTDTLIYPMKSIIGYVEDDDAYVFFYQDESGCHFENDCKAEVVLISDTEDSYLEKHTSTKTFLNEERRPSADDYITEEKETSFVLFLNEKQLIELTD